MTGAVEKVAAAIYEAYARLAKFNDDFHTLDERWKPDWRGIAEAAITALREDGWADSDESEALRTTIEQKRQEIRYANDEAFAFLQRAEAAEARNAAALALHKPVTVRWMNQDQRYCGRCDEPYPCDEAKALGGETATTQEGAQPAVAAHSATEPVHPYPSEGEPIQSGPAAFYVDPGRDNCQRCGDVNHDHNRVCLTCTYPDDPSSRAYLDAQPRRDSEAGGDETGNEASDA